MQAVRGIRWEEIMIFQEIQVVLLVCEACVFTKQLATEVWQIKESSGEYKLSVRGM